MGSAVATPPPTSGMQWDDEPSQPSGAGAGAMHWDDQVKPYRKRYPSFAESEADNPQTPKPAKPVTRSAPAPGDLSGVIGAVPGLGAIPAPPNPILEQNPDLGGIGGAQMRESRDETTGNLGYAHALAAPSKELARGLKDTFTPTPAEQRINELYGGDQQEGGLVAEKWRTETTPAERDAANRQATRGLAETINGGFGLATEIGAPELSELVGAATGGDVAAQAALAKLTASVGLGAGAAAGAGKVAQHYKLSPEAVDLVKSVAFSVPGLALHLGTIEGTRGNAERSTVLPCAARR